MPKIVDKDAKKNDIIQAALTVFAKKGVANAKMADIAKAAGIGKGTIYEYFRDKNEIFFESFNHFIEMIDMTMGRRLYRLTDPVDKLKAFFEGWGEIIDASGSDYIEIMLEFWAEGIRHNHDIAAAAGPINLKQLYEDFRGMIQGILEEGIRQGKFREMNTTLTAAMLIGTLDGLMLQWILDKTIFSIGEVWNHLLDEFLNGIARH